MSDFAPRNIVVGTDFGDVATLALRHAVLWAERHGARLTVVYVQEFPPVGGDPYFGDYAAVNAAYATYFAADRRPARTTVGVTGLAMGAAVEIDLIVQL